MDLRRAAAVEPVLVREVRADVAAAVGAMTPGAALLEDRGAVLGVLGRQGDRPHVLVGHLAAHDRGASLLDPQGAHLGVVPLLRQETGPEVIEERVEQGPDHRAVEDEQPPARQRVVVLVDPVVVVTQDLLFALAHLSPRAGGG